MATGVQPRDDDVQFTKADLETIQDAMKNKKFRELFHEYCEEVRDPANQALYQKEMTQLEKERGYDVTFINPKGGYVIKTSVAGDRKAFINICSNDNVDKPSCNVQEVNGQRGMNWLLPYSLVPPREDYNEKRERCVIYDVVFHPDTLRMAEVNKRFRELVNKTALDGLQKTYNIHLDQNNCRFPKSLYKGMAVPAVIRKEDPNYVPPTDDEIDSMSPEMVEKLFPQKSYPVNNEDTQKQNANTSSQPKSTNNTKLELPQQKRKVKRCPAEFTHTTDNGYTIPKYVIKQQKNVDLQDFTYNKDCKQYSAIPSQIIVEVSLPLLSSTKDCTLDVQEKSLCLKSEKPAKYKLNITLPYSVNDECGNAKFDKSKHKLIVTLPVTQKSCTISNNNSSKVDSGVESEENSGSQSEEENCRENLVVELSSTPAAPEIQAPEAPTPNEEMFFNPSLGYILPSYTHNALDDVIAFTFHVKNTDPDSVLVKKDANKISVKFTSIGSGFVPVHYGAVIIFDENVNFENVTGEAWDNNVILQMELAGQVPLKFKIGLNEDSLTTEYFDGSHVKKTEKHESKSSEIDLEEVLAPVVEVTNLGTETNIVVSSTGSEYDEDDDIESPTTKDEIMWIDTCPAENGAKSILRKPMSMMRSFSESSVGDVASSMDYISSDCIPEESSFKKTVRFSDVIARQFYRYNSSIEGQKKKNQRKKSKKRSQDRRKSESEAEDDISTLSKVTKPKLKSVLKQRRDSGLADTSDAEAEYRNMPLEYQSSVDSSKDDKENKNIPDADSKTNTMSNEESVKNLLNIVNNNENKKEDSEPAIWESNCPKTPEPVTCENIQHNTEFYNPDKLNKGQYLEVTFKNDLIFDLDM